MVKTDFKGISLEQAMSRVETLHLESVADWAAEKHGWYADRQATALKWYCRFLAMCAHKPNVGHLMHIDVDEMWHAHILHVGKYVRDCSILLGKGWVLDHQPVVRHNGADLSAYGQAYLRSLRDFRDAFGEEPPGATEIGPEGVAADQQICFDSVISIEAAA